MKISNNKVVGIEYTLKDLTGEIVDSNAGEDLLHYIQGLGNIVPGLERTMAGKAVGDSFEVEVKAADGYGIYDEKLLRKVPRELLKNMGNVKVGMMLQSRGPEGEQVFTVTHLTDAEVTLDGNHPMAGKDLFFAIVVKEIRDATADELAHGHAHGPGSHHHH